jgi:hypothetical protein
MHILAILAAHGRLKTACSSSQMEWALSASLCTVHAIEMTIWAMNVAAGFPAFLIAAGRLKGAYSWPAQFQ